jgi:hypothetical protein
MRSIKETIMQLTGKRRGNRDTADTLRSLVTLRFALEQTRMDLTRFAKQHAEAMQHEDSSLIYRWARGETAMEITSASRLDRVVPGAQALYAHPSFELLRDAPISKSRIALMLQRYTHPPLLDWWFGDERERGVVAGPLRTESSILVQRGDLDGFTVILGLMREAEARDHLEDHIRHAANVYRAFPAVARIAWFRPFVTLLRFCVERVHSRSLMSSMWWRVNWHVIHSQIRAEHYETVRHRWPRDPKTLRFIEPKDPVSQVIQILPMCVKDPLKKTGWALKAITTPAHSRCENAARDGANGAFKTTSTGQRSRRRAVSSM